MLSRGQGAAGDGGDGSGGPRGDSRGGGSAPGGGTRYSYHYVRRPGGVESKNQYDD
jgi:hypothetical protein